ncbi:MAG: hypothetical protein QM758_03895 [Armatimonas sp.]
MIVSTDEAEHWQLACDTLLDPSPELYDRLAMLTEQGVPIATVALAWHDTPRAVALAKKSGNSKELQVTLALFAGARKLLATPMEERMAFETLVALLPPESKKKERYTFIVGLADALQNKDDCALIPGYLSIPVREYDLLRVWAYHPQRFMDMLYGHSYTWRLREHAGIYLLASRLPRNTAMLRSLLEQKTNYWFSSQLAIMAAHRILERLDLLDSEDGNGLLYRLSDCLGSGQTWEDHNLIARVLIRAKQYGADMLPILAALGERAVREAPESTRRWARRVLRAVSEEAYQEGLYLRILALESRLNQASVTWQWRWKKRAERIVLLVENPLLRHSLELRRNDSGL